MKRFIIIGNGKIDNINILNEIIRKNDLVIAVDGGYDHLKKLSIEPGYLIGDMDSITNFPKNTIPIKILKFPKEKDKTDTEIAIEFAAKNKASEIILFGMTSLSRMDHSLNNIFLLENLAEKDIKNTLFVNSFTRLSVTKKDAKIFKRDGQTVSLVPLSGKVTNITTTGLKYKLKGDSLFRSKARGISNAITSKSAVIRFTKGMLLIIQIKGKPE